MGDEGRLYVSEDVVPVYKSLLRDAHLILPNQFEAEYVPVAFFGPALIVRSDGLLIAVPDCCLASQSGQRATSSTQSPFSTENTAFHM